MKPNRATNDNRRTIFKVVSWPKEIDAVIANAPGHQNIKIIRNVHAAPLGEFIKAYIKHQSIPWWRKGWDWKIVNDTMEGAIEHVLVQYLGQ